MTDLDLQKVVMTNDPRLAIQFASKKQAVEAARAIHWPVKSAMPIEVMGFKLWTLGDDHCRLLTRTGYAYIANNLGVPDLQWRAPSMDMGAIANVLAGRPL